MTATLLDASGDVLDRANLVCWHSAFAQASDDREWIVEGVIREGDNVAVAGPPGSGKSLFFLEVAARLAAGDSVAGFEARDPMNVLYLDHENNRDDVTLRLTDMGFSPEHLDKLRYASFPTLDALDSRQGGLQMNQLAHALDADVIIVDTISRFVDGDENAADTWQNLYRHTIAPLKALERTVIRLDHTGRDESKDARGSSAKRDDPDALWMFKSTPADLDGKCLVTLTLRKGRGDGYVRSIDFMRKTAPLEHRAVIAQSENGFQDRVTKCVAILDERKVPLSTGRPSCAATLRDLGMSFRNDVIAAAVRERKRRVPAPA